MSRLSIHTAGRVYSHYDHKKVLVLVLRCKVLVLNTRLGLGLGLDKKSWLHHWCTLKPGAGYGSPISCNSTRPFVVEHLPTLITCRFRYRASSGLIILPSRYGHCTSEKQCLYTTILLIVRVSYTTKHLVNNPSATNRNVNMIYDIISGLTKHPMNHSVLTSHD